MPKVYTGLMGCVTKKSQSATANSLKSLKGCAGCSVRSRKAMKSSANSSGIDSHASLYSIGNPIENSPIRPLSYVVRVNIVLNHPASMFLLAQELIKLFAQIGMNVISRRSIPFGKELGQRTIFSCSRTPLWLNNPTREMLDKRSIDGWGVQPVTRKKDSISSVVITKLQKKQSICPVLSLTLSFNQHLCGKNNLLDVTFRQRAEFPNKPQNR